MAVKRTITYTDLDGNSVSEDYYFNLDQTDAVEMDFVHGDDPKGYLDSITETKDTKQLLKVWKELLFASVAKREGNRLVKNQDVLDEFKGSGAYAQLFSELMESGDGGAEFFMEIMPKKLQEQIAQEQNKTYTKDELLEMSDEEFAKVAGKDENMSREHLLIAMQRKIAKAA